MQITVFGASGKVGQLVVAMALAKGYSVHAFVHSHNPFEPNDALQVIRGSISDKAAVREALEGSDAVISTLGSWHTKGKNVLSSGMTNILPAMKSRGIERIVTVTGAGALWAGDKPGILDKLNHALLGLIAPKILRDGEEHLRLLAQSGLDWTCVRSPVMTKSARKTYRLDIKLLSPWASIPRAAVAQSLVDQLAHTDYSRLAPGIFRA